MAADDDLAPKRVAVAGAAANGGNFDGVALLEGRLYLCPYNADFVVCIDPTGDVLGCYERPGESPAVVDPSTGYSVSYYDLPAPLRGGEKWSGICACRGKLFCAPATASGVLDRVGCFWPSSRSRRGPLDAARDGFFDDERVPADVAAWAGGRVAALERRRKCAIVGFAADGARRSKAYVEEFSADPDWQGLRRGGAPALEARLWDPAGGALAVAARKTYDHLPPTGAAAQLAALLPHFAGNPGDAAAVEAAFAGLGMYHLAAETTVPGVGATNAAWSVRLANRRAHADPASAGASADRAAGRAALLAAEPALSRFLSLPAGACGGGSWAACADAVLGAFLNNVQLSRSNSRGEPYLVLYYAARAADAADRAAWTRDCCRRSAPPERVAACGG